MRLRQKGLAALAALGAALAGLSPAAAQLPGGVTPDVQIVVMPNPASGDWVVSAVYPKIVPKKTMEAHYKRLLSLSGWKSKNISYETRGIEKNDGNFSKVKPGDRLNSGKLDSGGKAPAMSSATFVSESAVVKWQSATLPIEPFARAFRDLDRVYVTFFVGNFPFKGLRRHSDANLDVTLSGQSRGAFTYALHIKNHNLEALNLPRYEAIKPQADIRSVGAETTPGAGRERLRLIGTALVVALAAGAGIFAYSWAHRWGGR